MNVSLILDMGPVTRPAPIQLVPSHVAVFLVIWSPDLDAMVAYCAIVLQFCMQHSMQIHVHVNDVFNQTLQQSKLEEVMLTWI